MHREPPQEAYRSSEDEIDIRGLLQTLWRRRWVIMALVAACGVLAATVSTLLLKPVYESRAQILLSEHSAPAYATAESAARILTGPAFLEPLARVAGLEATGGELQRMVQAVAVPETRIVELRIRFRDRERLRVFAETVVREFVRRASPRVQERRRTIERRLAQVTAQLTELEQTVGVTRDTLEQLQRERPSDPAAWFARSFVVNSLATSEQLYAGLLNVQRDLRNDLLGVEFPTVVQAPYVAARPVSPRPLLNTGVAVVLGLIAGTILAFVMEAFGAPVTPAARTSIPEAHAPSFAVGPRAPAGRDARP
jgi:capsular polysaccharide biosynthesis protein